MSGTAEPVREPTSDAEWARDTNRRLESLENPTSQRIGPWVLSASAEGHLIASHVDGGSVVVARKPAGGENNPDDIQPERMPAVQATRTAPQSVPGSTYVQIVFDGVPIDVGGWTSGQNSFQAVTVPESGVYMALATAHFTVGSYLTASITVDGVTLLSGRSLSRNDANRDDLSALCGGLLTLTAGQTVGMRVRNVTTSNVGVNEETDTPTMLSLAMIDRS